MSIGEISWYLILPLINTILGFGNISLNYVLDLPRYPVIDNLFNNIILSLAFIPYLLIKKFIKKDNYDRRRATFNKNLIIYLNKKNTTIILVVAGIFFSLANIIQSIFVTKTSIDLNYWEFELIFITIASKILLKTITYKHHRLSLIIILVLSLLICIIDIIFSNVSRLIIIILLIKQILLSICIILLKYLFEVKQYPTLKLISIMGVTGIVVNIFILIFANNISCDYFIFESVTCSAKIINSKNEIFYYLDNLSSYFKDSENRYNGDGILFPNYTSGLYFLAGIIYRISKTAYFVLFLLIIKNLYPSHTYLTPVLISLLIKIFELFKYDHEDGIPILVSIIYLIMMLFIFYWTMIFNEIFVIDVFDLNEDVRVNMYTPGDRRDTWLSKKALESDADSTVTDVIGDPYDDE